MHVLWLVSLFIASGEGPQLSSVTVSQDEFGILDATPLNTWLYREGALPEVEWRAPDTAQLNPDRLHEAPLLTALKSAHDGGYDDVGGWRAVVLPHAVPGGIPPPGQRFVAWFVTEFSVPPTLRGRTVSLRIGEISAALRVFVNGQLVGIQGRDDVDDFWPGRRTVLGYAIPSALLRADGVNSVAVYVNASHVTTELRDVFLGDARTFAADSFWHSDIYRIPSITTTYILLTMAVYCIALYAARRSRPEILYFGLGTLGLAIILFSTWCQTWPINGVYFLRLTYAGIPLVGFYVPFFQRFYNVHHSESQQRWLTSLLLAWSAVAWVLPAATIMSLFAVSAPCIVVAFAYCTYLNFLGRNAGFREARAVLFGMAALSLCGLVQAVRYGLGDPDSAGPLNVGLLCFIVSIFVTLSTRVRVLNRSVDDYAKDLQARHQAQTSLVVEITGIAGQVDAVSRSVLASVNDGQRGSIGQSSAVAETKAAMQSLLSSGRNIMQAAQEVLHGAELTQRNNDQVSLRLVELSRHSQRIVEILNVIREVANKSDLLALNAALEGVRAGPLGRGFSLVATQMQQLAETIMRAVADIRELTVDIREASLTTESSNHEATRLASDTTKSARQISVFIAEQQSGTEQVSKAMEDIAEVAHTSAKHGDLTLQRMQDLIGHAERLRAMVEELNHGSQQASHTPASFR